MDARNAPVASLTTDARGLLHPWLSVPNPVAPSKFPFQTVAACAECLDEETSTGVLLSSVVAHLIPLPPDRNRIALAMLVG
jgi:hypothetical protein